MVELLIVGRWCWLQWALFAQPLALDTRRLASGIWDRRPARL